ncbi:SRPBCC family protein [Pseudothermotoga thermarum]|uniref:Activator of Hsp90 ATPase 1 family protein n=1 Tax=Pseudothermotoga thermarum DSM 5069 TaxID=688269 RepID=F7YV98_9THEM|nr:SRPBCC domain-containing protein [Pseudothermotoga thermarum]AEH50400.1 Activator of Hsp90 ATPase 1 family protein [Pseudothermotoga thermarum DSM 5069]
MLEIPKMTFVEYFKAPLEKVWKTFVNPNGWDPWFTDGMKVELKNGGQIYFRWKRLTNGEIVEDKGITILIIDKKLWEFWWYEYEDGFRSQVKMVFQPDGENGTWLRVEDRLIIKNQDELQIAYGCAYGWGQMLLLAKIYIEKGEILL